MDQPTYESTIKEMVMAYRALDQAKSDCKDVVESSLDALADAADMTDNQRKALIKIAKAMAAGKEDVFAMETETLADVCNRVGLTS